MPLDAKHLDLAWDFWAQYHLPEDVTDRELELARQAFMDAYWLAIGTVGNSASG